ncbi:MAG: sulfatase-like hydrolase/transferase, partial [Lachnospiraceae bacterium]|nr:sulfatase-like hydrolase/transferase [Lachnospiraceae bacterium]
FDNYYTPLWYGSTLGGEYADLTGLMPKNGGYLSMAKSGQNKNDMMFTLSRQLLNKGYKVTGYHNNYYDYYDRNISHPNLGYEWIGVGSGYEPEYGPGGNMLWPQSDERMIETTFDEYADDEPFHTYYLTVSGHVMYNFGGNAMAKKHMDLVEDLDYSETTKAYIACQYELELAMEKLVEELESKGIADNTLIVLTADHVPYDNKEVEDELAGYTLDNTFEWYENTLRIWSASMEKPVYVDKCCSSLDILPTVSNLMGLDYDSRMLVGQDIMSDSEGLVMFNDRSFITDSISYNGNTQEVKSLDGKPIDEDYVASKVVQVRNKFNMAEKICDYNYYKYIDDYLNKEKD